MNQTTNLIQWKNLSKDEQAGFDFEGYQYQRQNSNSGYTNFNQHTTRVEPLSNAVYRLVIQPDKWYYCSASTYDGLALGKELIDEFAVGKDMLGAIHMKTLRPATEAEIPKPAIPEERGMMFQLGIQWRGGKFAKMHLDGVEIDPKDLLSHMDFLAGIKS